MILSVIIPTYNRPDSLGRLLISLTKQSYPITQYEVIVIDDGSSSSYKQIIEKTWPFQLVYLRQENAGEAVARNYGAQNARSDFLVFLDDDMEITPPYLEAIYTEHMANPDAILIGTMYTIPSGQGTLFQQISARNIRYIEFGDVPFTNILAGVMAISSRLYSELGGMQAIPDKKRGGWIDMDFAFRAHEEGYRFRRVKEAIVYHDDYAINDRSVYCQRIYKVSLLAVDLFNRIPKLKSYLPMFRDKIPIDWRQDSLRLIIRKIARKVISSKIPLSFLENLTSFSENYLPIPGVLIRFYRWIIGAYIYRGYQAGLQLYSKP